MILDLAGGAALCALASLLFYLSAPNQRLLPRHLPLWMGISAASLATLAGGWLLMRHMGGGSAIFTLTTIIMAGLTLLPFIGLLRAPSANDSRSRKG